MGMTSLRQWFQIVVACTAISRCSTVRFRSVAILRLVVADSNRWGSRWQYKTWIGNGSRFAGTAELHSRWLQGYSASVKVSESNSLSHNWKRSGIKGKHQFCPQTGSTPQRFNWLSRKCCSPIAIVPLPWNSKTSFSASTKPIMCWLILTMSTKRITRSTTMSAIRQTAVWAMWWRPEIWAHRKWCWFRRFTLKDYGR